MHLRFASVCIVTLCLAGLAGAADPLGPATLLLQNDDRIAGQLCGSENAEVWRWRSPLFSQPLEFRMSRIRGVHYPVPAVLPQPAGEYCFELNGDDVVFADLAALSDKEFTVTSSQAGTLTLPRSQVHRFYRWKGEGSAYFGPNGLTGWTVPKGTPSWKEEGGQLIADQKGAVLFGDVGIPDKAIIEIGLSWKSKPDFIFALGVAERDEAMRQAFRFEVWEGQLVVVGESKEDADLAIVQPVGAGPGQVRVMVYLDQVARRLTLLSRTGKPLATMSIDGKAPPLQRGVRLVNSNGDVRLEYLRVSRWNGPAPGDVRDDQPRVSRMDGSILYGRLAAYNAKSKQFTVREGERETEVASDTVAEIYPVPPTEKTAPAVNEPARSLRVVLRDGARLSGTAIRIEDTHLTLACPGIKETLRLPLVDVRSLIPLRLGETPAVANAEPSDNGRAGRLEAEGVHLKGRLLASARPDASALVWQPETGQNSSPLLAGFSGRIVYRDPPPPRPIAPAPSNVQVHPPLINWGKWFGDQSGSKPAAVSSKALHLRIGDSIPCEVTRIDERGVTLKSPQSSVTFVPHDKIKSVQLVYSRPPELDEIKRDRLLTLPRMQKGSPPTHLICSKTGDILRGRIIDMDDTRLRVEVKLEIRDIPRDRVNQIIWLHPDELQVKKPVVAAPDAPRTTRAQTINRTGNRLTFVVGTCDGESISGTSDVLGSCRVKLDDADQILFGSSIEQSAAQLAYQLWKLHHAAEPKFVQGDGGSGDGAATGLDSPLVGKPAPTIELDRLDGSKFKLADRKGKVVVIDFWATWCGPCLKSMPLVDGVAREFADRGVELIAVNMEEPPDQVKSMLDRHKFKMQVALDRDGVVAARYSVTSIPQVVVIDREGNVARLFIGGGNDLAESLRKVLQQLSAK